MIARPREPDLLRGAAREALAQLGIGGRRLRLLRSIRSAVFRVDLDRGGWVVLRVQRAERWDPPRAHLEAALLQRLVERSSLRVPRPLPAPDGSPLLGFESRALGGWAFAMALRPVTGRRPPLERPSARTVGRSGAVLAEIHDQGQAMRPGRGLRLPHADWGPFVSEGLSLARAVRTRFAAAGVAGLRRQIDRARAFLRSVGSPHVGVLHGDFHQGNYVIRGGAVWPIDFADCAVGAHICDLATAITALAARPGYAAKRAALLRGYRSRRELPGSHEDALDALVAARVAISLVHVFDRPDHPYRDPRILPRYVALSRARLHEVGVDV